MKKSKVELSKKLLLNKETITGLSPAQQQEVEGGKVAPSNQICMSGSGCDCAKNTCGIVLCLPDDAIAADAMQK